MKVFLLVVFVIISVFCSCSKEPVRVYYVNSYHAGYPSSDAVEVLLVDRLSVLEVDYKVSYLDGKHLVDDSLKKIRADSIFKDIMFFKPNIIIVSDDDAAQYLVSPYLNGSGIPILHCGINWNADKYNLDGSHIRGIIEVLPLSEVIDTMLHYFPYVVNIGVLSEYSLSEQSNTDLLDTLYKHKGLKPTYSMVEDFDQWLSAMAHLSSNVDMIYLPTNGGIRGWNSEMAKTFITNEVCIPVFTCESFMNAYVDYGLNRVLSEPGEWLSASVVELINGASITDIANTKNRKVEMYTGPRWLEKISR